VEPAAPPGLPDEEMPNPSGNRAAGPPEDKQAHHNEQMFDKNKAEKLSTWLSKAPPGYRR
jgi:hypothetical protein